MSEVKGLRFLLMEDNPADADLIREIATGCPLPCHVVSAQRLAEGLARIGQERFDAVLLDLGLPDSSGLDTLRRFLAANAAVAVVVLTGLADERLAAEAIGLGAQDYLVKGEIDSKSLLRAVRYAIERKGKELALREAQRLGDALNEINTLIFSTTDIERILRDALAAAVEVVGADAGAVYRMENGNWIAHPVYGMPGADGRHYSGEEIRYSIEAIKARRPKLFIDLAAHETTRLPVTRDYGLRTTLDAPLIARDKVIGNIALYSRRTDHPFSPLHLDFLRKVTASLALAMGNALLFQEQTRAEQALRENEALLREVLAALPVGVWILDRRGNIVSANRMAQAIWGGAQEDGVEGYGENKGWWSASGKRLRAQDWAGVRALMQGESIMNDEIEIEALDGSRKVILNSAQPIRDEQGAITGAITVYHEITARKRAEESSRRLSAELEALLSHAPIGLAFFDREHRYIRVNRQLAQTNGLPVEAHLGQPITAVLPKLGQRFAPFLDQVFTTSRSVVEEIAGETPAAPGELRHWLTGIFPVPGRRGAPAAVGVYVVEICERKRMEEEIRRLAHNDALTGLPNRRLFTELLTAQLSLSRRTRQQFGVLFLDLDRFKEINDTLGHDVGDQLLKEVALCLREQVRESDTVARIGGDEFNILVTGITRAEDCAEVAQKFVESLRRPFVAGGHTLYVTSSIGISLFPEDGEEMESLLKHADIAMYAAKEAGRNTFRFYSPQINVRSMERMRLERFLREAVEGAQFVLHYQPLYDLRTRQMAGAEALLRWNHPERGLLEPEHFIPLAEETGLICALDEWVLRAVCEQVGHWQRNGVDPPRIAVNISARLFQNPSLVEHVARILDETGMPSSCLDFEITESMVMRNVESSAVRMGELTRMGLRMSIDDFGTGYSSLSYLKKLPIQRIKIDRSFIKDIARDPDDRAIVQAVTAMAHSMKMRVVAEGVETDEQMLFLKESACDEVQGFLFGGPVSATDFRALVTAGGRP